MKKYQVVVSKSVKKKLEKLPVRIRIRIVGVIEMLSINPYPPNSRKLHGRDGYRLRTSDYRVLYKVNDEILHVVVVTVGHRRDVYER